RCRTYGDHGLILETSTHLEDIAMSDYFQIDDRFVAQPSPGGGLRVDVKVEVKFFKNTMLRRTIEGKSLKESQEVWGGFFTMAKAALGGGVSDLLPMHQTHARGADRVCNKRGEAEEDEDDEEEEEEKRVRRTQQRLRERRRHRHRRNSQNPLPIHNRQEPVGLEHGERPRAVSMGARVHLTGRSGKSLSFDMGRAG
ncbi:unnamed protein product, partial [Discosporangium mesarthrocarpum]